MAGSDGVLRIAQISDMHCGGPYFEASLLERAISEINEIAPDAVVCSGDLTTFGFRHGGRALEAGRGSPRPSDSG